jgi:dTDP-4-amino-4,6-dideoxygalactose transaminase
MAIFSFQMNKNMTAGKGGCVVTRDLRLYRRAVAVHDLGYSRDDQGRLMFDDPDLCLWGRGYRLDELRGGRSSRAVEENAVHHRTYARQQI